MRSLPSRIGTLVDMTLKELEKVLYFESYVVIDPGETTLQARELLTERKYREARDQFGEGSFKAEMVATLKKADWDDVISHGKSVGGTSRVWQTSDVLDFGKAVRARVGS